ncbi:hypothetical protein BDK51DRAFT_49638 [Blyttiomyces helicus]|uniref:Uncharacterized protein n=1 Tax=Blyttiomyces helicus TaxID=388810 RepID=A0A4P9WR45_9FUNG|nr:hypothetical protein BDK51DRAFT_49638 [Blyttiomyces helicus]|eukprot:RKO93356.1 hypothetical protein BDK51DRAFT_49638 [Blyttiomyces helicus]
MDPLARPIVSLGVPSLGLPVLTAPDSGGAAGPPPAQSGANKRRAGAGGPMLGGGSGSGNLKTSHKKVAEVEVEKRMLKVQPLRDRTYYERLVYACDCLVPDDEPSAMEVPDGSFLQQVHYGKVHKWRVAKNPNAKLPSYLVDHKEQDPQYIVFVEHSGILPLFDSTSLFLKRWDALSLILLLFTASVTPFETA